MTNKRLLFCLLFGLSTLMGMAQEDFYQHYHFTKADSLRGQLRLERTCYDVTFYELELTIDPARRFIEGFVDIHYQSLLDFKRLQIDLYENMTIQRIEYQGQTLAYERIHQAVFIDFPKQVAGSRGQFRVYYAGQPTEAIKPPWDGGFVWQKDSRGQHWVGVACEGDGASLWWPNKDHLSDEPDSMAIRVAVPEGLTCVANGNLQQVVPLDNGFQRFDWWVSYPINNYNVTVNIADYAHFSDTLQVDDGSKLPLDYYVLRDNLSKAKKHFEQVPGVLQCFEHYFDKYPFWNDGYALVETPYLGMEHQSAIAYGNRYLRGYLGGMIPRDMDWDYIIVHETGHEYFGNSVGCQDLAEMWINESFTTYMEALYVECASGYEDAVRYLAAFRNRVYIKNQEPILGPMNVNWEDWQGSDHYFKGSWMLHTLRHSLGDDELWFDILKSFYQKHAISTVRTQDFIDFVKAKSDRDFIDAFFRQYLQFPQIPKLEYTVDSTDDQWIVKCRWARTIPEFNMPVMLGTAEDYRLVSCTTEWTAYRLPKVGEQNFKVATELMLIDVEKMDKG